MSKQIVVLQRGWVVVGDVKQADETLEISDASVIRIWGTTKGLGELALHGPTAKTVLDSVGTIRAHELTTVMRIDVDESVWTAAS